MASISLRQSHSLLLDRNRILPTHSTVRILLYSLGVNQLGMSLYTIAMWPPFLSLPSLNDI